ncbi:hypothetical protein FO519_004363 [Halicephalobus sp. NKZ332]|nr:hypothetical protein FO519_004363 [Halicephalobus sp. NKZ332]
MKIPEIEFFQNLGDWPLEFDKESPAAIVSWCGSDKSLDIILPTYEMTDSMLKSMDQVTLDIQNVQAEKNIPFEKKINKAVFRGRDSNRVRIEVAKLAKDRPDLVDGGITKYFFFEQDPPPVKQLEFSEFFKYKFVLNIDGTVAAYRFPFLLAGNSVVLKQESSYREHFYPFLKPNVHYIPFGKEEIPNILENLKSEKKEKIRESNRPNQPTNPSKRHRERLNGELETVAALLPYDDATIQRLDKLSVLRLAVSFVQIKAHFALYLRRQQSGTEHVQLASLASTNAVFAALSGFSTPIGPIPTLISPAGVPAYDLAESSFSQLSLKTLGGFVIVLTEWGDLYYVSENIDQYLGFCQSDVLHQSITDLLHSEDRENILKNLKVQAPKFKGTQENPTKVQYDTMERLMIGRFRCLLDNTCGFVRMEIRGRFVPLCALATPSEEVAESRERSRFVQSPFALAAICTPFVPPVHLEGSLEDPILKTKHGLDLGFLCIDGRLRIILEIEENSKSGGFSFYQFIHPDDAECLSECHDETRKNGSSALLVLRIVSTKSRNVYYFQSSFRLFYKSGKPESIGITHRFLTEADGLGLLEKRGSIKGSIFTHDEPSLQSPRNLSTAQNLPPLISKDDHSKSSDPTNIQKTPRKISTEKSKKESNQKDLLPPIQLPSTSALGAINCLEELVKASTSTLCAPKDVKPNSKKAKVPNPPGPSQDPLPPIFNPYFQPDLPPAPQNYPVWSLDPHQGPVDFHSYYPPGYNNPYPEQWRHDPNYFFQDSFNNYYSQFYPEAKAQPGPQGLIPLLPDPGPPQEDFQQQNQNFFGAQFNIPNLNPLQNFAEKDPIDQSNNFSFFNVAHTLFGQ